MIPSWKAKREVMRLVHQLRDLPKSIADLPRRLGEGGRRAQHERDFLAGLAPMQGAVPLGKRVAVFLLYQPTGLSQSTFDTCARLVQAGFAPLVVSNAPVSAADRAALGPLVWQLIERPNFGYDFGGYRDAIRFLWREAVEPDWMIIMNDSVWHCFTPNVLDEWMAQASDLTGLLQDEKVVHRRTGSEATARRHVESYFYLIRGALWRAPAFRKFWEDYQMSDDKPYTIKNGEIGFSRHLLAQGINVTTLSDRERFLAGMADADADALRKTLRYASYDDAALAAEGAAILAEASGDKAWQLRAHDHIRRTVLRRRFNSSFCYANHRIFGTLSLKKSREEIFVQMRKRYLEAVTAGDLPAPNEVILAEMKSMAQRDDKTRPEAARA